MFVVALEGIDGSGKTTMARNLKDRLQELGYNPMALAFPTAGPVGSMIRGYLRENWSPGASVLQMLFAADKWELVKYIEKAAGWGNDVIILDRYTLSGVAYGMATGLEKDWLLNIHEGLPRPDLTVQILEKIDVAMQTKGGDLFEKVDIQKRVADAYTELWFDGHIDLLVARDTGVEAIAETIGLKSSHVYSFR